MGDAIQGIKLRGDPKRNPEPECVRVMFPGGEVDVVRTTNDEYWIHIRAHTKDDVKAEAARTAGRFVDARLDVRGRHSSDCNTGDFSDPNLEHLAVRVGLL